MQKLFQLFFAFLLVASLCLVDFSEAANIRNIDNVNKSVLLISSINPKYSINYSDRSFACLSEAIYQEAGTESDQGKEAVGIVILNRAEQRKTQDICSVVREYKMVDGEKVCQFTYNCLDKIPAKKGPNWYSSSFIAMNILHHRFEHGAWAIVGFADHYHANYVHPKWSHSLTFMGQIGNHLFYRAQHLPDFPEEKSTI